MSSSASALPFAHLRVLDRGTPWSIPSPAQGRRRVAGGRSEEIICVDLDGTLITTDHLPELLASILKRKLWALFPLLLALLHGKAAFKRKASEFGSLDVALLPYHAPLLAHLRARQAEGARLFLVTAADVSIAQAVSDHLQLFEGILASDGVTNLSGSRKAEALVEKFGLGCFTYFGNGGVDLPVWQVAGSAGVVSRSSRLLAKARQVSSVKHEIAGRSTLVRDAVRALRPHQWLKNLILLVPVITSHQLTNGAYLLQIAIAFAAFSATASAIYIINDVADLESDRRHPRKRSRPWAAGALPLTLAPILTGALLLGATVLCTWLPPSFAVTLAVYVGITSLYSFWLKREVLVDVFVLAALYSIRLVAGHAATGIATSVWLFMFSMFIFLSLALIKRAAEVYQCRQATGGKSELVAGRGYLAGDLEQLSILGTGCGLMAVLIMALYVTSPDVQVLYRRPALLLLACPLLLYWISRLWLAAHRGQMHDDPVVFAVKDRASYFMAAGIGFAIVAAKFSHLVLPS